jgi:hypothetical protein
VKIYGVIVIVHLNGVIVIVHLDGVIVIVLALNPEDLWFDHWYYTFHNYIFTIGNRVFKRLWPQFHSQVYLLFQV